jgi:hypothetical protein
MKMKQTLNTKRGRKSINMGDPNPTQKKPKNVKRYKRNRKNKPQGH